MKWDFWEDWSCWIDGSLSRQVELSRCWCSGALGMWMDKRPMDEQPFTPRDPEHLRVQPFLSIVISTFTVPHLLGNMVVLMILDSFS
jgi:hypothetical protein